MTNDRRFTFRIPDEMYEWLKARAEWRETNDTDSIAAEIRNIIRSEISREGGRTCNVN